MKKLFSTKKRIAMVASLAIVALGAAAAFAYFTTSGNGAGSASVGSAHSIALSSPLVGDLYPGGADVPVTVTIDNSLGQGAQYVGDIKGSVTTQGDCLGSWFEVDTINYHGDIAAGATDTAGTKVRMVDSDSNQNACQGLTMAIVWTSDSAGA